MNSSSIFVGNLAWTTTSEILEEFGKQAGDVVTAEVMRHADTNRSKGWGLLRYPSSEVAQNAVALLNGRELNGRNCHVRFDRTEADSPDALYRVFIGNLPWSISNEDLLRLFEVFEPANCHLLTNMYGRSRGFAIMQFRTQEKAESAIESMHHYDISGRKIDCRFDRGPGRSDAETKPRLAVFVGNLDPSIDENMLQTAFEHIGPINSLRVSRNPDSTSKGWGVVKFETSESAKLAVTSMNHAQIGRSMVKLKFDRN